MVFECKCARLWLQTESEIVTVLNNQDRSFSMTLSKKVCHRILVRITTSSRITEFYGIMSFTWSQTNGIKDKYTKLGSKKWLKLGIMADTFEHYRDLQRHKYI